VSNWEKIVLDQAPITRAAFGLPGSAGPRPIEGEWAEITSKHDQDAVVYVAGAWNRGGDHLAWGYCAWQVEGNEPGARPHIALRTPATRFERLLSPLAHEARIRIMQAMYDGPKPSGQLSAATGYRGGNLYYHLKELIYAGYVTERGGGYDLTALGCQMLVTVATIAQSAVRDRGE